MNRDDPPRETIFARPNVLVEKQWHLSGVQMNSEDVIGNLQNAALEEFGDALKMEAARLHDLAASDYVDGGSFAFIETADPVLPVNRVGYSCATASGDGKIVTEMKAAIELAWNLNHHLNAFTAIDEQKALSAAVASQERHDAGQPRGPIDGMIVAHKDLFDRDDHLCSFGSRIRQSRFPARSAEVIGRLADAGAVTIGALTMAEFALGATGHNSIFGHCRNPWNPARVSGGSSSGAASAVAAGIVSGSLGSDTGGSIRIPASCCGVVGLKPTQGRVSTAGVMPLSWSLDCVGPLARRVVDCALLFDAITIPDLADPDRAVAVSIDAAGGSPGARSFAIAYPKRNVAEGADVVVAEAIDKAAAVFAMLGGEIVERSLPDIGRLHALADIIQRSEAASAHARMLGAHREAYSRPVLRRVEGGLFVAAPAYVSALNQRSSHLRHFLETTLRDVDVLLIPTVGIPVPFIDETDEAKLGPLPELIGSMTRWTRWLNYLGVPALSVPCGEDANGMPIGMQLVGRPGAEFRLLTLAAQFERVTPWHQRRPCALSAARSSLETNKVELRLAY
ncbi:MAG: amidase [Hyphomicrobiales bacterium]|nr:amidase [Hyphomicrobiales bacterium]